MDLHLVPQFSLPWQWPGWEYPGDRVVATRDPLEAGPLTADLDAFRPTRLEWLRRLERGHRSDGFHWWDQPFEETLDGIDRICLWITSHMRDSITAAYVAARLRRLDVGHEQVDVVDLGRRIEAMRLGKARSETGFAGSLPRRPVTAVEWRNLEQAWLAVTSPTAEGLLSHLAGIPDTGLPSRSSLALLRKQFPDGHTGIDVYETCMLRYCAAKPGVPRKSACVVGAALRSPERMPDDQLPDGALFATLLDLGDPALPRPLVEIHGDGASMATTSIAITDFGREVLAGQASFLDHNPIDRQVAGVHLSSATGQVWLRDGDTLVPA